MGGDRRGDRRGNGGDRRGILRGIGGDCRGDRLVAVGGDRRGDRPLPRSALLLSVLQWTNEMTASIISLVPYG